MKAFTDDPAFWEASDERGLIFYQGDTVIRIPKDKLPNLMLDAVKLLSRKDGQ